MRYDFFVLIAALALAVSASAGSAQADAVTGEYPATVPADVQFEPMLSDQFAAPVAPPAVYAPPQLSALPSPTATPVAPSYFPPTQPGVYPNMQASWNEDDTAAQPDVACENTGCSNNAPWTRWYFEADLVGFTRNNISLKPNPLLPGQDFGFDIVPGPYLVLGTFVDPHNQWQLVYFIAPDMSANTGGAPNYDSTLQSAELNYIHTWNRWSFLAGFRYLNLDEQLRYNSSFNIHTVNNLYGGQIGIMFHHEWSWILVEWAWKFGVYGNSVVEDGRFGNGRLEGNFINASGSFEDDLFLGHRFSPHWMGRIGLVDLIFAPDIQSIDTDGTISVLGLTIGALAQW